MVNPTRRSWICTKNKVTMKDEPHRFGRLIMWQSFHNNQIFIKGTWFSHYHSIRIWLFLKLKKQFILPYITDLEALATTSKFNALLGIRQQYAHCILHWWLDKFYTPFPYQKRAFFFFFCQCLHTNTPSSNWYVIRHNILLPIAQREKNSPHTKEKCRFYSSLLFMWCCFDNLVIEREW